MKQFYYIHDYEPVKKKKGMQFMPNHLQAQHLNKQGYGIYWAINDFKDGVRRKTHLERINAWWVEMDDNPKQDQLRYINTYLPHQ